MKQKQMLSISVCLRRHSNIVILERSSQRSDRSIYNGTERVGVVSLLTLKLHLDTLQCMTAVAKRGRRFRVEGQEPVPLLTVKLAWWKKKCLYPKLWQPLGCLVIYTALYLLITVATTTPTIALPATATATIITTIKDWFSHTTDSHIASLFISLSIVMVWTGKLFILFCLALLAHVLLIGTHSALTSC